MSEAQGRFILRVFGWRDTPVCSAESASPLPQPAVGDLLPFRDRENIFRAEVGHVVQMSTTEPNGHNLEETWAFVIGNWEMLQADGLWYEFYE